MMSISTANRAAYSSPYSVKAPLHFKGQKEVDEYREQFKNYSDDTMRTLLSISKVAKSRILGWARHIFWAGWYGLQDPNVKKVNNQIWELRKHKKDNDAGLEAFNEYLDTFDEDLARRNILKQNELALRSNFFKNKANQSAL